jgi:uncharacterized membrane protein SirB2
MDYGAVKLVHETAVAISFTGFFARGCGMLANAGWVHSRPARTLPHVVDTILLLSAISLAYMLRITPVNAPWLAAKIIGLLLYIGLGMVALRRGKSKRMRAAAWGAALLVFGYIVCVAITKSPLGFMASK